MNQVYKATKRNKSNNTKVANLLKAPGRMLNNPQPFPGQVVREIETRYTSNYYILKTPDSVGDMFEFLQHIIGNSLEEKFITLFLHGEQIAGWTVTGIGVIDGVLVHPREVFRNAIITNSTGIVIAHNHPSGSLEISRDDVAITKRLIEAGEIIGIPLIDHFIITGSSYISFKAAGYIIDEDESENEEILLKELA